MIAFGHTAVGALVGIAAYNYLGNGDPITGLAITTGAGIISHYLADLVPHGHFFRASDSQAFRKKVKLVILGDFGLSVLLFSGIIFWQAGIDLKLFYLLAGIIGSQAPDILDGFIYTGHLPNKGLIKLENDIHQATHWHGNGMKALLINQRDIWQLSVVLVGLWLTFRF